MNARLRFVSAEPHPVSGRHAAMTRPAAPRRRPALLAATLVAALGLAACGSAAAPTLGDRTFLSTGLSVGGTARPLVEGTRVRLVFGSDGQVGASAGCNSIGGTWRVDGTRLAIQGGAMTEMGCDDARHAQDDWLVDFLTAGPTVALAGNDLTLSAGDTVLTLLDREVAEPDLAIVGPTWLVHTLIEGDAASSVPAGVVAGLEFAADGTVQVRTGCNEGSGTWTMDGDRIRFGPIVTTKKACEAGPGMTEGAVMSVLSAPELTVAIDASTLTLMGPTSGLQLSPP